VARGSAAVLANSQCRIAASGVGMSANGTTLTLSVPITFLSAYAGAKHAWVYALANSNLDSTWIDGGTWTVPDRTLTVGTMTPTSGHGMTQTFSGDFDNTFGRGDIGMAQFIFLGNGETLAQGCLVGAWRPSQTVYLLSDDGQNWTSASIGSSTVLQNSRCSAAANSVTVSDATPTTWHVNATITFASTFLGERTLFGALFDPTWAVTSTWIAKGTWTMGPRITQVAPTTTWVNQPLVVSGEGFGSSGGVTIDGAAADVQIGQWTDTSISLTFASGANGTLAVTRGGVASNGVAVTVSNGPHIDTLSPTWGPSGTSVTVHGSRFGSSGALTLHGAPVTIDPANWHDDAISFTVSAGGTTGDVVVVTAGTVSNGVPFIVGDEGQEYYHTDGIGSVRMLTGYQGYVQERHDYLPFGEEWPPRPDEAHIGFGGKEKDEETGNNSTWMALNYFGARSLEASIGRFSSPDPVNAPPRALGTPQRWNQYSYVENNPLRYVDPDGRDLWEFIAGIGNALSSNSIPGVQRQSGTSDFRNGQFFGDVLSAVQAA
jgi:RHS repeat-associated protein